MAPPDGSAGAAGSPAGEECGPYRACEEQIRVGLARVPSDSDNCK